MRVLAPKIAYLLLIIFTIGSSNAQAWTEPHFSLDSDTLYVGQYKILKDKACRHTTMDHNNLPTILGEWGEEIRLTHYIEGESTASANSPIPVNIGDTIALGFYYGLRSSPPRAGSNILFSGNFGSTWQDTIDFHNPDGLSSGISDLELRDSCILVCGAEARFEINRFCPYFRKGYNFGNWWQNPVYLLPWDVYFLHGIRMALLGDTVHYAFYQGDRILDPEEHVDSIYYVRGPSLGSNWDQRVPLTYAPEAGNFPLSMASSGGAISIIFEDWDEPHYALEILQLLSTDAGISWNRVTLSTPDSIISQIPSISASSDSELVVTWMDYKYGSGPSGFTGEILGRASFDGGRTWGPEFRVTNSLWAIGSAAFIKDNHIGIAWEDQRTGLFNGEIYFAESVDGGQNWSNAIRLTNAINDSDRPRFIINGNRAALFWEDARDGAQYQYEIYMRYYDIETSIISDNNGISLDSLLWTYPNPFNSKIVISCHQPIIGLEIYDITGLRIKSFFNMHSYDHRNYIIWDGTNNAGLTVSSGVYFLRALLAQGGIVSKITLVR